MKIVSIINNKGGVGKTTTTLHLASLFSRDGFNTLLVDLDPQTNLSQGFIPKEIYLKNKYGIEEFMKKEPNFFAYQRENVPNLKIIQGSKTFNPEEFSIDDLKTSLQSLNDVSSKKIDYVFIDCPPHVYYENKKSLQMAELAVFTSEYVLIPIKADIYSYEGIVTLLNSISAIEKKNNTNIKIAGIFINQAKTNQINYNAFNELYKTIPAISQYFLNTCIRENAAIDRSSNANLTIFEYAPNSMGAEDFIKLYKEVKNNLTI